MMQERKLAIWRVCLWIGLLAAGQLSACSGHATRRSGDANRRRASSAERARGTARPQATEVFVADGNAYRWTSRYSQPDALANRIAPPEDYVRVPAAQGSFARWLRGLPLKSGRPDVLLYNGQKKPNQEAHHAVVDMDVGERDLQQCADAIMRLRAEYLLWAGRGGEIKFRTSSGFWLEWNRWEGGERPVFAGRGSWRRSAAPDSSYRSFRAYLEKVFEYVGTASLSPQLQPVERHADMQIGDVFIKGGHPGHAVIVVDMAECEGDKVFLLAQSFMPAQEVHILKNLQDSELSPWYDLDLEDDLQTPEWTFELQALRRFPSR